MLESSSTTMKATAAPAASEESDGRGDVSASAKPAESSWLTGTIWNTWGKVRDATTGVKDRITEIAQETWTRVSTAVWSKKNADGSVSQTGVVSGQLVIPPVDEFNWKWQSGDDLWKLSTGKDKDTSWATFRWDSAAAEKPKVAAVNSAGGHGDKVLVQAAVGPESEKKALAEKEQESWRRDGGERHVFRNARAAVNTEITVKDGHVFKKDASGAETEVTAHFWRAQTKGGEKLLGNNETGEVFHESEDGAVSLIQNGVCLQQNDKRHSEKVLVNGGRVEITQLAIRRKTTIDRDKETIDIAERRSRNVDARLKRYGERMTYSITHDGEEFQSLQDKHGNQYYKDESETQYWRSADQKQTVKTKAGAMYRQDKNELRIYRTADEVEYRFEADGRITVEGAAGEGHVTVLADGSRQLADGAVLKADGTLRLTDGTTITRDGTVLSSHNHKAERSGVITFRDGQVMDLDGLRYTDGSHVSKAGDVELTENDGSKTTYRAADKSLKLASGAEVDNKGITTREGTRLNFDRSVETSDGTRISSDHRFTFADGTEIAPDGTVSTADGWVSGGNFYRNGIEFTSETCAMQAAASAADLVASLMARVSDGSVTYADIESLRAALGDLSCLARVFTLQGKLDIVSALTAASGSVQGALAAAVPQSFEKRSGSRRLAA